MKGKAEFGGHEFTVLDDAATKLLAGLLCSVKGLLQFESQKAVFFLNFVSVTLHLLFLSI